MVCSDNLEAGPDVFRIMLVDDDELVGRFLEILLESYGCKISVFNNSMEAMVHFQDNPDAFDALITDVLMPGLTGDCLAEKILAIKPEIPVVLISGYAPNLDMVRMRSIGVRYFLNKPIENNKLMRIIDEFRASTHPEMTI